MSREQLLLGLVALVGGTLAWLLAPIRDGGATGPAWVRERRAWRLLVAPIIVIAIGTATLSGWALQEPEVSDERLSLFAWFVVVIVLALWTRALARFGRSLTRRPALPIAVVGLVKPRVVFDPALAHLLDTDAFGAALAHEEAHRRHRDPLRIALAQLAVDLQWPWPQARRRLASWREALEEARDDEAICDGAHPDDLAAAIIGAAQLAGQGSGAALTGTHTIERRIGRLLESGPRERPGRSITFATIVGAGLLTAAVIGFVYGEELIALLPGVMR